MKNVIKLNESQLRQMVVESVKNILNEKSGLDMGVADKKLQPKKVRGFNGDPKQAKEWSDEMEKKSTAKTAAPKNDDEAKLQDVIAEAVQDALNEAADRYGNGNPNFFQRTLNTGANRAYNFRRAVQNNPEYNAYIQANAKKAMGRNDGQDMYGSDYVSDDFNTLKKQAGKGVMANKIAKDVYQQKFQNALQGEKDAANAHRRAEAEATREQFAKRAEELKQDLQYEFTKSPINWKEVEHLQGSLASTIGRDEAIKYVSDLKKSHGYTGTYDY